MANEDSFILFTYGTLMRGELNEYLLDGAKFLGVAQTKPTYSLLSIPGNYPFPALMEGGNTAVVGEVYEVPIEARDMMDRIEGHPYNYCRKPVALEWAQATKWNGDKPEKVSEEDLEKIFKQSIAYVLVNEDWTENALPIKTGDWRKR